MRDDAASTNGTHDVRVIEPDLGGTVYLVRYTHEERPRDPGPGDRRFGHACHAPTVRRRAAWPSGPELFVGQHTLDPGSLSGVELMFDLGVPMDVGPTCTVNHPGGVTMRHRFVATVVLAQGRSIPRPRKSRTTKMHRHDDDRRPNADREAIRDGAAGVADVCYADCPLVSTGNVDQALGWTRAESERGRSSTDVLAGISSALLVGERPATMNRASPDAPLVLDTTELRWFVPGSLPADVGVWFTGSTGVLEERTDTYRLDGRGDIGVKRRFRETMELKVRQSLDGRIEFGDGLAGSLEVWRRWSPAEALVEHGVDERWVDVRKSVVKRRFLLDGTEVAFSPVLEATGAGCDVEVAGVTVDDVHWWTFAFAAFGPPAARREALLASWRALVAAAPCPERFEPRTARAMGYPELLMLCT